MVVIALAARQPPAAPPGQLLQASLTASAAADAFHYRAVWRDGGVSQTVIGDARAASGSEVVSVDGSRFTAVLTGHVLYFDGDEEALRAQLGLPPVTATQYAGRWISLEPSDDPYPFVEEGLTTSAALAQVLIAPDATSPLRTPQGMPQSRITGRVPHGRSTAGSAVLDVLSRSKLLVTYSASGSDGGQSWSSTITFSHWDEHVAIDTPLGAVPFSSLPRH